MSSWIEEVLVCPDCGSHLHASIQNLQCSACNFSNPAKDLRPKKDRVFNAEISRAQPAHPVEALKQILTNRPKITYDGPPAIRDSRELMSVLSGRIAVPGRVLDLGCGPKDQKVPIEYLGYRYLGVDYSSKVADFLADAHSLPFKENSFECVFSYAVLEHLHNPFVAISEIERVLTDGGIYIGSVSQGEPFHESYFHHTAWGFLSLLASTKSMRPIQLWACNDTLRALSRMGRYSRVIRALLRQVDWLSSTFPILTPRKMQWPLKDRQIDSIHRAGSIGFVVQKVVDA